MYLLLLKQNGAFIIIKYFVLEDLRNREKYWIKEYDNFPMKPLKWLRQKEKSEEYMSKIKWHSSNKVLQMY